MMSDPFGPRGDNEIVSALSTTETFANLGKPEHAGMCFAITHRYLRETWGGDAAKMLEGLPRPDYDHRIYLDQLTDNYIVMRPDNDGAYKPEEIGAQLKLIR
jgi:hypothetical protein